ncbi:MAG: hypothetical protein HOI95_06805 [Chromatiales bacterium]|jgi:hypothetical protein|nr:hypothetical protein [Chromatiales bacterium]
MTLDDFERSLEGQAPPTDATAPLTALWLERKGDWSAAHTVVQDDESVESAWVHAYLHRVEGDLGNAKYWYGRAQRTPSDQAVADEWRSIAAALMKSDISR